MDDERPLPEYAALAATFGSVLAGFLAVAGRRLPERVSFADTVRVGLASYKLGRLIAKDPVTAAKVLSDFAKENDQRPTVKGGLLEGKALDVAQVKKLASMPSREQMLAELGAGLQSPMAAFVGALNGLLYMFAGALEALRMQRESA